MACDRLAKAVKDVRTASTSYSSLLRRSSFGDKACKCMDRGKPLIACTNGASAVLFEMIEEATQNTCSMYGPPCECKGKVSNEGKSTLMYSAFRWRVFSWP